MRVALDSAFKPDNPENYTWWNFVEPIELRCAALSILRNMEDTQLNLDSLLKSMFEDDHDLLASDPAWKSMEEESEVLKNRLAVHRECLQMIAHCGYIEREGWGERMCWK